MEIRQITDKLTKQSIARLILEALPDWFGIPEAREEYITESIDKKPAEKQWNYASWVF